MDVADLQALEDRLAEVSPRRGEAVGYALLGWAMLALSPASLFGVVGCARPFSCSRSPSPYLPAVLLLTAAIEPSETAERLIAWVGSPALAIATLAVFRGWTALGVAAAITVGAEAVDMVAGSPLTSLSLLGPNPSLGVRFYGIGNELEATLVALALIGTGAALSGLRPKATPGFRAAIFIATALVAVIAFAPGRFGADVGAAIGIPVGAATAVAVLLGGGRSEGDPGPGGPSGLSGPACPRRSRPRWRLALLAFDSGSRRLRRGGQGARAPNPPGSAQLRPLRLFTRALGDGRSDLRRHPVSRTRQLPGSRDTQRRGLDSSERLSQRSSGPSRTTRERFSSWSELR